MSNKLTFFNSILLTLSTIFTLSAIVTNFVACSNETGKTPGIEEKLGLAGKTISFMGDSITTYGGWSNLT